MTGTCSLTLFSLQLGKVCLVQQNFRLSDYYIIERLEDHFSLKIMVKIGPM